MKNLTDGHSESKVETHNQVMSRTFGLCKYTLLVNKVSEVLNVHEACYLGQFLSTVCGM